MEIVDAWDIECYSKWGNRFLQRALPTLLPAAAMLMPRRYRRTSRSSSGSIVNGPNRPLYTGLSVCVHDSRDRIGVGLTGWDPRILRPWVGYLVTEIIFNCDPDWDCDCVTTKDRITVSTSHLNISHKDVNRSQIAIQSTPLYSNATLRPPWMAKNINDVWNFNPIYKALESNWYMRHGGVRECKKLGSGLFTFAVVGS